MARWTKREAGKMLIRCNQCEAAMINGVFCHETGCPNSKKRWNAEKQDFERSIKCWECGFEFCPDDGDGVCDCQKPFED